MVSSEYPTVYVHEKTKLVQPRGESRDRLGKRDSLRGELRNQYFVHAELSDHKADDERSS